VRVLRSVLASLIEERPDVGTLPDICHLPCLAGLAGRTCPAELHGVATVAAGGTLSGAYPRHALPRDVRRPAGGIAVAMTVDDDERWRT
jgi:hypothetical protein